jgi:hypothetical protein
VAAAFVTKMKYAKIIRAFAQPGFVNRAVPARMYRFLRNRLNVTAPLPTEDRRVLEQIIFGHYRNDPSIKTVLFVGCDSYTAHYERRYFAAHDYWTIDPDTTRRRFGAKHHVVARLQELGQYFPTGFFNLIVCNGVFGWGLNSVEDCDAAMSQCHACLTTGGYMLLGWNDVPGRGPAPCEVRSLSQFSEYPFPAFGTSRYFTNTAYRHTYYFYNKGN